MDWADELAASVSGPQVINDSKTPSGTVHVGSLRGPVIHDALWRAVRDRGLEATYLYGVDDMDPMDTPVAPDAATPSIATWACRWPASPRRRVRPHRPTPAHFVDAVSSARSQAWASIPTSTG